MHSRTRPFLNPNVVYNGDTQVTVMLPMLHHHSVSHCSYLVGENGVLDLRWARLQLRITEGNIADPPVLTALVPWLKQLLIKPGRPQAEQATQVVIVNSVTGRTDRRTKGELVQQLSRKKALWAPPLTVLVSSDMMVSDAKLHSFFYGDALHAHRLGCCISQDAAAYLTDLGATVLGVVACHVQLTGCTCSVSTACRCSTSTACSKAICK